MFYTGNKLKPQQTFIVDLFTCLDLILIMSLDVRITSKYKSVSIFKWFNLLTPKWWGELEQVKNTALFFLFFSDTWIEVNDLLRYHTFKVRKTLLVFDPRDKH